MDLFGDLPPPKPNGLVDAPSSSTSSDRVDQPANQTEESSPEELRPLSIEELFSDTPPKTTSISAGAKRSLDTDNEHPLATSSPPADVKRPRQDVTYIPIHIVSSSRRGRREAMQDAFCILPETELSRKKDSQSSFLACALGRLCFAAVLDGHGGSNISNLANQLLPNELWKTLSTAVSSLTDQPNSKTISQTIVESFKKTDGELLKRANQNSWRDGACAVISLVIKNRLYIAHVGDCKAVLAQRTPISTMSSSERQESSSIPANNNSAFKAIPLTQDHEPTLWNERQRIQKAGGIVKDGRVMGQLEVSRAFGDARFKAVGVTCEPEVCFHDLVPQDTFLILACDGLWKSISPQEAVEFVGLELNKPLTKTMRTRIDQMQAACVALVNEAIRCGSLDNVTAVIYLFEHQN